MVRCVLCFICMQKCRCHLLCAHGLTICVYSQITFNFKYVLLVQWCLCRWCGALMAYTCYGLGVYQSCLEAISVLDSAPKGLCII